MPKRDECLIFWLLIKSDRETAYYTIKKISNFGDFKLTFHAPKFCIWSLVRLLHFILWPKCPTDIILSVGLIWKSVWVWSFHLSNLLSATHTSDFQWGRKQLVTLSDSQEAQRGLARKARAQIQPKVNFNSGASESSTPVLRWKWQWIWNRCHIWSQRSNGDDLTNASPLELWEFQQRLWTCNRGLAKWWKCVSP